MCYINFMCIDKYLDIFVACNCNGSIGRTGDCDKATGTCLCKDNVTSVSANCDSCLSGYYNLTNVNGCQPCNCFPSGSVSSACDAVRL